MKTLRYNDYILLSEFIFTSQNALSSIESFSIFYDNIFRNSALIYQKFFHGFGFIVSFTFLAAYDNFFNFPMVIQKCSSIHSIGKIRIGYTRFHFRRSAQNQRNFSWRNFRNSRICFSFGNRIYPKIG